MTRYVTDQERHEYGDSALDTMRRAALESVDPHLRQLAADNQNLHARLQRQEAQSVYDALDAALPNWRAINQSPEFWAWLKRPGELSGVEKQRLLNQAFASGDSQRVLAFLQGFLAESGRGQQSRAPAQRGERTVGSAPVFTTSQINKFYADGARAAAQGKPADPGRAQIEAQILRAAREGRIVNR